MNEKTLASYVLPLSIINHGDLYALSREVETIEESLQARRIRGDTTDTIKVSHRMQDFLNHNKVNIASSTELVILKKQLIALAKHSPTIHMTFASEIDQKSLEKIVEWLRSKVTPTVLVSVGLQPSLVGGVYLRTPDKVFDFTIKSMLSEKRDIVRQELEALHGA